MNKYIVDLSTTLAVTIFAETEEEALQKARDLRDGNPDGPASEDVLIDDHIGEVPAVLWFNVLVEPTLYE